MKCDLPEEMNESNLKFYFRHKLFKLTGISHYISPIRCMNNNETCLFYYRCHKFCASNCKSKSIIIFDKINKLANIYQNNEQHHHHDLNIDINKYKYDLIKSKVIFILIL